MDLFFFDRLQSVSPLSAPTKTFLCARDSSSAIRAGGVASRRPDLKPRSKNANVFLAEGRCRNPNSLDALDGPHRVQSLLTASDVLQRLTSIVPAQQICSKPLSLGGF